MRDRLEIRSQKSEFRSQKAKIERGIVLFSVFCFLFSAMGCEAFVRKFTRKPKKDSLPREEMVLVPEEYKPTMTKEEQYRQYFLFWKSWQDEIIEALVYSKNHKKQIDCVEEAIENLLDLRVLLNERKQKQLDAYINQLTDLKDAVTKDIYGSNIVSNRQTAERIKRNILRDFSYHKVSKDII